MYTTTPVCRVALATAGGKAKSKSALDLRRIPDLREAYKEVPMKHPFEVPSPKLGDLPR